MSDISYRLINIHSGQDTQYTNGRIARFLHDHLDEFGDEVSDITKAIDYVFTNGRGGNVLLAIDNEEIVGAVVMNETGMSGYIPENILVYIAVDRACRGKGVGKGLINNILKVTKGDIALHVEPDNPAIKLYEKIGFENKYLEMRYKRK